MNTTSLEQIKREIYAEHNWSESFPNCLTCGMKKNYFNIYIKSIDSFAESGLNYQHLIDMFRCRK